MSFLWSNSRRLLSFDQVLGELRSHRYTFVGLQSIPVGAVVGSEGRWRDFSRDFQPNSEQRKRVLALARAPQEVRERPVEVYQLDQIFFLRDGHHRLALARLRGQNEIAALVTRVETRATVTAELDAEEVLLRAQLSRFLEVTNLDRHDPQADLAVTASGLYEMVLEHVEVHRYYLGTRYNRAFTLEEAAASWYDLVYQPVQKALDESGARSEFPGRSSLDLYLWIAYHRELARAQGDEPTDLEVARALTYRFSERPGFAVYKRLRRACQAAWKAARQEFVARPWGPSPLL